MAAEVKVRFLKHFLVTFLNQFEPLPMDANKLPRSDLDLHKILIYKKNGISQMLIPLHRAY